MGSMSTKTAVVDDISKGIDCLDSGSDTFPSKNKTITSTMVNMDGDSAINCVTTDDSNLTVPSNEKGFICSKLNSTETSDKTNGSVVLTSFRKAKLGKSLLSFSKSIDSLDEERSQTINIPQSTCNTSKITTDSCNSTKSNNSVDSGTQTIPYTIFDKSTDSCKNINASSSFERTFDISCQESSQDDLEAIPIGSNETMAQLIDKSCQCEIDLSDDTDEPSVKTSLTDEKSSSNSLSQENNNSLIQWGRIFSLDKFKWSKKFKTSKGKSKSNTDIYTKTNEENMPKSCLNLKSEKVEYTSGKTMDKTELSSNKAEDGSLSRSFDFTFTEKSKSCCCFPVKLTSNLKKIFKKQKNNKSIKSDVSKQA